MWIRWQEWWLRYQLAKARLPYQGWLNRLGALLEVLHGSQTWVMLGVWGIAVALCALLVIIIAHNVLWLAIAVNVIMVLWAIPMILLPDVFDPRWGADRIVRLQQRIPYRVRRQHRRTERRRQAYEAIEALPRPPKSPPHN